MDIQVRFPSAGRIDVYSDSLFGDLAGSRARQFVERVMRAHEVTGVTVRGRDLRGRNARAEITFNHSKHHSDHVLQQVIAHLAAPDPIAAPVHASETHRHEQQSSAPKQSKNGKAKSAAGADSIDTASTATLLAEPPEVKPIPTTSRRESVIPPKSNGTPASPDWLDRLWPHEFPHFGQLELAKPEGEKTERHHILTFNKNGELVTARMC